MTRLSSARMRAFMRRRKSLNSLTRLPIKISSWNDENQTQSVASAGKTRNKVMPSAAALRSVPEDRAAQGRLNQPHRKFAGAVFDIQNRIEFHHFHAEQPLASGNGFAHQMRFAEIQSARHGCTGA